MQTVIAHNTVEIPILTLPRERGWVREEGEPVFGRAEYKRQQKNICIYLSLDAGMQSAGCACIIHFVLGHRLACVLRKEKKKKKKKKKRYDILRVPCYLSKNSKSRWKELTISDKFL